MNDDQNLGGKASVNLDLIIAELEKSIEHLLKVSVSFEDTYASDLVTEAVRKIEQAMGELRGGGGGREIQKEGIESGDTLTPSDIPKDTLENEESI